MPAPDQSLIARQAQICADLRRILPDNAVVESEEGRRAYDADGLSAYRQLPLVVALPETVSQLSAVMQYCHSHAIK
ncbi:MAG: FAD-binding oxidoreductase, partial [Candidatus Puniceispirillum sp.]